MVFLLQLIVQLETDPCYIDTWLSSKIHIYEIAQDFGSYPRLRHKECSSSSKHTTGECLDTVHQL
jgi:hypothetical protein